MVDLVLELEHPKEGSIATRRYQFAERCHEIEERIAALSGEVVGRAWINSTMLVRVPADAVSELEGIDGVQRVDTPHKIERD